MRGIWRVDRGFDLKICDEGGLVGMGSVEYYEFCDCGLLAGFCFSSCLVHLAEYNKLSLLQKNITLPVS